MPTHATARRAAAALTAAALCAALAAPAPGAEPSPTTLLLVQQGEHRVQDLASAEPSPETLVVALAAEHPPTPGHRIGFSVVCEQDYPRVPATLTLQFSFFPDNRPVQATITNSSGDSHALSKPVRGGRASGFHIYTERRAKHIGAITDVLLRPGASASDGNAHWRNAHRAGDNAKLRELIHACLRRE